MPADTQGAGPFRGSRADALAGPLPARDRWGFWENWGSRDTITSWRRLPPVVPRVLGWAAP